MVHKEQANDCLQYKWLIIGFNLLSQSINIPDLGSLETKQIT